MQEGVIEDPADGDVGAVFGVGFPAYTGGPFSYIDHLGAERVVRECAVLAKRYGERFKAPRLLKQMASAKQRFYPVATDGAA